MNKRHLVLLVAAFGVAACGQQNPETDTASHNKLDSQTGVVEDAQEEMSPVSSDCPTVDDVGQIEVVPGLTATILTAGTGRVALADDFADAHTTLWLYDETAEGGRGLEIWSSGGVEPFQFQLGIGQVIKGWDLGVPCMRIGETRELIVAGELGYGPAGRGQIPPNATLLFNIELVDLTALQH